MVFVSGGYPTPPLLPCIFLVWANFQLTCVKQHGEVPSLPAVGGMNSRAEALYPSPIHWLQPLELGHPLPRPSSQTHPFALLPSLAPPRDVYLWRVIKTPGQRDTLAPPLPHAVRGTGGMLEEENREQRCGPQRRQPRHADPRAALFLSDTRTQINTPRAGDLWNSFPHWNNRSYSNYNHTCVWLASGRSFSDLKAIELLKISP